ncbi:hypothetical protein Tco_0781312 [Tanacetum coccineum]
MTSLTRVEAVRRSRRREGTPPQTKEQIDMAHIRHESIINRAQQAKQSEPDTSNSRWRNLDPKEDRISPELAKRFASSVPKTVDEMMKRLDEFVRAEEAYALAELPLGESRDIHRRLSFPAGSRDVHQRLTFPAARRDDRDGRNSPGKDFRKGDYRNSYKGRDNFNTGRHRDYGAPYHQRERANRPVPVLSLDSLTKCPKEILATETQLQLPPPRPVANPLRTGDPDKYCDYHQDKGHHTNDCIQLRKQLEIALESGKLNHLMKDLRQRVERRQNRNPPVQKVINMVNVHSSKKKKRKDREATESWMNTPISFPPIMTDDASDEPLIIEAEVEGYLVRRVYVDEGSSVEVMFEHCFENLPEKVKAGLRETRTDLVGFAGEVSKPLGKIDLEGGQPEEYTHAIPSTIHSMIKFPTPKGIATLIARTITIAECRKREEKQMIREETPQEEGAGCKEQLRTLLESNMEVFAWEPADMTGCLADANLHVPLDEIKIDKTLHFVKEPVEIMDREVKTLKRSKIPIVKVRWNSKRGPEFTWEREDHMKARLFARFCQVAEHQVSFIVPFLLCFLGMEMMQRCYALLERGKERQKVGVRRIEVLRSREWLEKENRRVETVCVYRIERIWSYLLKVEIVEYGNVEESFVCVEEKERRSGRLRGMNLIKRMNEENRIECSRKDVGDSREMMDRKLRRRRKGKRRRDCERNGNICVKNFGEW